MKIGITTLIGFAGLVAIAMVVYYTYASPLWISAEDAKKGIADGTFPIVLDVRTNLEYKLGHYPGAIHIPTAELATKLDEVLPTKTDGILVYCNTGQRSRHAADVLKAKGYKKVRYISGPYLSLLH